MIIPNLLLLALTDTALRQDSAAPRRDNAVPGWAKAVSGRGNAAHEEYCNAGCCGVECCIEEQSCCQAG